MLALRLLVTGTRTAWAVTTYGIECTQHIIITCITFTVQAQLVSNHRLQSFHQDVTAAFEYFTRLGSSPRNTNINLNMLSQHDEFWMTTLITKESKYSFWSFQCATCSVKISWVKMVFILLRELGLMAICAERWLSKIKQALFSWQGAFWRRVRNLLNLKMSQNICARITSFHRTRLYFIFDWTQWWGDKRDWCGLS